MTKFTPTQTVRKCGLLLDGVNVPRDGMTLPERLEAFIRRYDAVIKHAAETFECPQCKRLIAMDSTFCPHCGAGEQ
jgi:hypothetical protein